MNTEDSLKAIYKKYPCGNCEKFGDEMCCCRKWKRWFRKRWRIFREYLPPPKESDPLKLLVELAEQEEKEKEKKKKKEQS